MELISREDAIRVISLLRLPDNDTNYCVKAYNDAIEMSQEAISQISVIEGGADMRGEEMTYQEAEKIVKWCNEHKWESDRPLTQRQVEAYKIWLRGKEMLKICETCKWWHDSACVCMNEKSGKFTKQVAHTETCREWETADIGGEE